MTRHLVDPYVDHISAARECVLLALSRCSHEGTRNVLREVDVALEGRREADRYGSAVALRQALVMLPDFVGGESQLPARRKILDALAHLPR